MKALRKNVPFKEGKISDNIPEILKQKVESSILPLECDNENCKNEALEEYFEIEMEDGRIFRTNNWTDKEWNDFSLISLLDIQECEDDSWRKSLDD